jgi:lipid II:glycine glycyltransferase (peptidoglycan interpeptide bridge formation enzyme)
MVRFRVETIPLGAELEVCEEKRFLESAVNYLLSIGADVIIPPSTNTVFRTYPSGADTAPYGSYVVDLRQPEETLWSNIHPKNRNAIRNATKRGVKIRSGTEYLEAAYVQVRDTLKRSGLPFMSMSRFERMLSGGGHNVKIIVADYQGILQGCAVNFHSDHSAYSLYAGSLPRPLDGATKLLHWHAMRLFRDLGVARYDFGGARIDPEKGSKQGNLSLYKRHLGGRLVQGYMWKYSLRGMASALYSLLVRFLRGGDIVDRERHKLVSCGTQSAASKAHAAVQARELVSADERRNEAH